MSATSPQPPTIGCSAVAAPSASHAQANRPRPISPTAASTSAHAKTFDSQPPITHSPAAVVCRSASEKRAAARIFGHAPSSSGSVAHLNPQASESQPSHRPTQSACSSETAAAIGPMSR